MGLYVISDLHIAGTDDPLYAAVNRLIRERLQGGDTLVLAGDVFDFFVGNKAIYLNRYRGFIDTLRDAGVRGVKMHYIEGNHDFQIRRAFYGIPGLTIHSHDVKLEIGGKRFFVAHGDTVDRTDYGYRFLRAFFRSPLMKAFVTLVPGTTLDWIGRASSRKSSEATPRLPSTL
ncbi:MAG: UDP-2,3-diacylglucosamine diphosphatase, partial [Bdellovibrionota bacterium]